MSEAVEITGGKISYGRTIKTAEYENKRGDVELSFNVGDEQDADFVIDQVKEMARSHIYSLLGIVPPGSTAVIANAQAATKPGVKPKAARMPKAEPEMVPVPQPPTDAAAIVEETPPPKPAKAAAKAPAEENLDDIMGAAKEITDAELTAATTRCQAQVNNAPAIRKLLGDFGIVSGRGRLIDLPQDKRQAYLDGLTKIKPLA